MATQESTTKAAALRGLIESKSTEFIMEAHNGLSARIVEEAGFKGIWASGLAMSAQHGVRDNNELSWTQVVDSLEFMTDATSIPILLDGDTGYGDFNSMRRLVRKLEQRGVGGVCIEDKLFPKTNSFIQGERQPLANIDEFAGKIKAGKDSQADPDFCIVARVEALIAGWGQDEAIKRAEAYHAAGADAILIHSKRSHPDEILAFAEEWANRLPLLIVPTKYYSTPTAVFRRAKIDVVIWANHMMRSCIAAMQQTARDIHENRTLVNIEGRVASVREVFRLQGAEELLEAERRYTKAGAPQTKAVVLAATRGDDFASLTDDCPKVMLPVAGKPLLARLVDSLKTAGINEINVVTGYKSESVDVQGVVLVDNPDFASSGELTSLTCAMDSIADDTLILYGDLLFRDYVLSDLLECPDDLTVVVDSASAADAGAADLAYCSVADDRGLYRQDVSLERVSGEALWQEREPNGRWVGMIRVQKAGREWLMAALAELKKRSDYDKLGIPDLLNYLVEQGRSIKVVYIHGNWLDVNSLDDLQRAREFSVR